MRRIAIALLAAGAAAFGVAQAGAAPTCTTSAQANGDWASASTWTAGVPGAGVDACIPSGFTVTIGSATMAGPGTTTIQAGGKLQVTGYPTLSEGRVLDIEPSGRLELTTDNRYVSRSGTTPPLIRNRGTIARTVEGPNDTDLRLPVENDGLVVSDTGRLVLSGGGTGSSGSYGGGAGAVELGGGIHELADGAALLGGVELTAGELTVASGTATSAGATLITGGTLGGPGGLSVESGTLTWSGGTMRGPGTTTVKAGATLANTGYTTLSDGRLLDNRGTFELPTDNRYVSRSGTTPPLIRNTGTIRRTVAGPNDADLRVPVENDGLVVSDTGRLVLSNGGDGSSGTYGGGAGTVELGGGTHALAAGAALAGGVELTAGELTVASGATATSTGANQISGGTVGGPGGLSVESGTLTWSGGTMRGPGTTTVKAGATLANTGYTTLSDGRVLANQGTFELPTDNRYVSRSGTTAPVIRNTGTIRRTATGTVGVDLRLPVDNDGTIVSDDGLLQLTNGGDGGSSGTFGGGAGQVRLSTGSWQLDGGAELQDGSSIANTTVTVADGATATASGAVTMTSGTITGGGTFAIAPAAVLTWSGGAMAGTGTTAVAAGGRIDLTGTGSVSLGGSRTVDVSGLMDFKTDGGMGLTGVGAAPLLRIAPGGTLRKSAGTLWSYVSVPLRNEGTADGQAGKLMLMDGAAQPHSGRFTGRSATEHVVLGGDGHVLTSAARLEDFTEIEGDVVVRDGDVLTIAGQALQTGGELSGDVAVTGTLTWSGGSHELPGTTTIAAPGRIVVAPEAGQSCANANLGDGRRLDVLGLLRLPGGSDLSTFGDPRPEVHNAGRIEIDSGGGACGSYAGIVGDGLVANAPGATIEKLGGAGDSQVSNLDNDGTLLNSAAGLLRIDSNAAIGHAGAFRTTGAGSIAFDYGDFVFDPGATLEGNIALTGADLRLPEDMTLDVPVGRTLTHSAGSVSGAGDLRIAGALAWTGGTQEGPGATLVEPGATVSVAPADGDDQAYAAITDSRSLVNRGTMTVEDAYFGVQDGASILNRGTLELRGASELYGYGYGYGYDSVVHNTGVMRKTGTSTIEARVPVDNDGTVQVDGGTLMLDELVNWTGNGFFGESGIAGGEYVVKGTLAIPDVVRANGARLVLDGAASKVVRRDFMGRESDALATLDRNAGGGELVLRGGRSLTVAGPFVNQGVLDLGPASTLSTKDFRQTTGAVLRPAVTGGGMGRVAAAGPAQLGGRLDTPAAPPLAGDHVVLSAPSVGGSFSAVTGGYAVDVSATEVRLRPPAGALRTVASPEPEPAVADATGDALAVDGPWQRRRAVLTAARRGARLAVPAVRGRELAIVARTCRGCGAVRVRWAGRTRTIRLAGRPARRTIRVFALGRARTGTVRLTTTSGRRVAVRALLVRR